jgi:hypothetical protein
VFQLSIKHAALILLSLILYLQGFAQQKISGYIKDEKTKQALPFPSIGIAGTQRGTIGDQNGYFELEVNPEKDTLKISVIGYKHLSVAAAAYKKEAVIIYLNPEAYTLQEITVKASQTNYSYLGTIKYSQKICTAFVGENDNWRGEQAAILAINKEKKDVYFESFGFYIVKNEYADSLQFRLMLYEADSAGYPGATFLKKPILFKTNIKKGEVRVDLTPYKLTWGRDFFISLECLEAKMEAGKFCFAGSIKVPSYVKISPFARWLRVRGGGGDFNVRVR